MANESKSKSWAVKVGYFRCETNSRKALLSLKILYIALFHTNGRKLLHAGYRELLNELLYGIVNDK